MSSVHEETANSLYMSLLTHTHNVDDGKVHEYKGK
jgi:hypothetical protein